MLYDPRWFIVILFSSLVYGALSSIVAARKMYFLAGALPHSALLSVVLSVIASKILNDMTEVLSLIFGILFTMIVAALLAIGLDPDTATAIFVSFSVSITVIGIYYVLTLFPAQVNLWAYILGDPLLVSWRELQYMGIISTIILIMTIPFLREHILIGVDRDFVRLSGVRTGVYDVMLMVALALATVGLLRVVGFVIEHVMLLLPGSLASIISSTGRKAVLISFIVSIASGMIGLMLSIFTSLAPSGLIGLVLLMIYILSLLQK